MRTPVNKKSEKKEAYKQGVLAEKIAALFLRAKGYKIRGQRFRSGKGEIDLIATKGRLLIFVEVKSRKSLQDGLYAITPQQKKRIISAAEIWLSKHKVKFEECRFDVILLTSGSLPTHIKNAFMRE